MTNPAINPLAASGFGAGAEAYERGRPTYPPAAIAALVRALDLGPGTTVLDLGAGTGKLTRLLVPSGARILALEPVAGMRAQLAAAVPQAELVDGTAEAIPLPGGFVDAVVVAQAFHWFDADRALAEIHRVLRPGGRLALAWNFRDEEREPWVAELGTLIHRLAGDAPRARGGRWRDDIARTTLFTPFQAETFRHTQSLDVAGVLDRVASISYVASASAADRDALLADVAALLASHPDTAGREIVELPYVSEILWAERLSVAPRMAEDAATHAGLD